MPKKGKLGSSVTVIQVVDVESYKTFRHSNPTEPGFLIKSLFISALTVRLRIVNRCGQFA